MPYSKAATKTMAAMKKRYGSNWAHVYYGLANKRAGKGLKGKHRGHVAANRAYRKGSSWGGKKRGRSVTVRTRGKTRTTRRVSGHRVRIHVH